MLPVGALMTRTRPGRTPIVQRKAQGRSQYVNEPLQDGPRRHGKSLDG
jgi:hypothetical protein